MIIEMLKFESFLKILRIRKKKFFFSYIIWIIYMSFKFPTISTKTKILSIERIPIVRLFKNRENSSENTKKNQWSYHDYHLSLYHNHLSLPHIFLFPFCVSHPYTLSRTLVAAKISSLFWKKNFPAKKFFFNLEKLTVEAEFRGLCPC